MVVKKIREVHKTNDNRVEMVGSWVIIFFYVSIFNKFFCLVAVMLIQ